MFITLAAALLNVGTLATPSAAAGSGGVNAPTAVLTLSVTLSGASGSGAALPPTPAGYTTTVLVAPLGTNLILQSEALGTAPWSGTGATVTADSTVAPDGTTTADTLTRVSSSSDDRDQSFIVPPSGVVSASVYIKHGTSAFPYIAVVDSGLGGVTYLGVDFSGTLPVLAALGSSGGVSSDTFRIAGPDAFGFYRVSFRVTGLVAGHTGVFRLAPDNGTGNGSTTIFWGAQVAEGADPLPYFKTTTAAASIIAGAWGTAAVQGPTVQSGIPVAPSAAAGTGTAHGPSVRGDATTAPSAVSATGAINAPATTPSLAVSLSTAASSTGAVHGPAVVGSAAVTPSAATGTGAVNAPAAGPVVAITPAASAGTGAVHGPAVRGDASVSLTGASSTGAASAPSTAPVLSVTLGAAAATGAVHGPTVAGSISLTPATIAGTGQVHAPAAAPSLTVALPSVSGTGSASPIASGFQGTIPAIIAGLTSAQSETHGWNAEVKAALLANPSSVVRTSDTVVTITLPAVPGYDISAPETITPTIPGSALVGAAPLVAAPTFTVGPDPIAGVAATGAVNSPSLILDYLAAVLNAAGTGAVNAPVLHGDVTVALGSVLGVNLILRSEALDQTPWYGTGATVTADAVTAPDGTLTGDRLTRSINANDFLAQDVTLPADGSGVASVSLRQETSAQVDLELFDWTSAVVRHRVSVTWIGGVPVVTHVLGSGITFHEILAQPNGWYRIAFTATGLIAAHQNSLIALPSPAGANGDTVSVWGAEVTAGSTLLPYARTTTAAANIVGGVSGVAAVNGSAQRSDVNRALVAASAAGSVHAPAPVIGTVVAVASAVAAGSIHAPVAVPGAIVTLSAAAGAATVHAPVFVTNTTVTIGAAVASGAIHAPNARVDAAIALTGAAGVGAVHAPSTGTVVDASVTPGSVVGTVAVNAPDPTIDAAITIASSAASASVNDVAVRGDVTVAPEAAAGDGAANAPFVGFTVTPSAAAGVGAANAPTVSTARDVAVTGAAGTGALNSPSPKVDHATTLPSVAGIGAVNAPTIRGDVNIPVSAAAAVGAAHRPTVDLNNSISTPLSPVAGTATVNGPAVQVDETLALGAASATGAANTPSALPSVPVALAGVSASGDVRAPSTGLTLVVSLTGAAGTGSANAPVPSAQVNTAVALGSAAGTASVNEPGTILQGPRPFSSVVFADVAFAWPSFGALDVARSAFTDVEVLPEGP